MAGGQGSSCGTLKGPGVGPTPAKAKWGPHNPRLGVEFPRFQRWSGSLKLGDHIHKVKRSQEGLILRQVSILHKGPMATADIISGGQV